MDEENSVHFKNSLLLLTFLFVPGLSIDSRSVNLAVETSFLFDPQDITKNATLLHKVEGIIDKLKTVLGPDVPVSRQGEQEHNVLSNFLTEVGSGLIKIDNKDIKKFAEDLSSVVKKLANKNEDIKEMVEDTRLISYMKDTANNWATTDPMKLKVEIAKYLTSDDNNAAVKFFKILNKFFDKTDEEKFKKLISKFSKAKDNSEYKKFLYKTIDFIVIKRFMKLNFLLKQIFKQELKKFTADVHSEHKQSVDEDNHETQRRLNLSNIARSQVFSDNSGLAFSSVEEDSTPIETNKRAMENNEVILDENLHVNVRKENDKLKLSLKLK